MKVTPQMRIKKKEEKKNQKRKTIKTLGRMIIILKRMNLRI
jgi:hypothetical protein